MTSPNQAARRRPLATEQRGMAAFGLAAKRVPEVTVYFWVVKILTTGMGEATSDFLVHRINRFVAGGLGAAALVVALLLQFSLRRYVPWAYWTAVAMVSVFGTMAADGLHVQLHVPYIDSTLFYIVVLAVIFIAWRLTEGTLSISSVVTRRREGFYWATVLATFALGTAASDFTAYTLHWGFFTSGVVFLMAFVIPLIARRWFALNAVFAFWCAYTLTRPLGASFADWFAVPRALSGLDLGRGTVAVSLTVLIVAFVSYLSVSHRDTPNGAAVAADSRAA